MKKLFLLLFTLCATILNAQPELYLIGPATQAKWSLDNAPVLRQIDNSTKYQWTGLLAADAEFKVLKQKSFGSCYNASTEGEQVAVGTPVKIVEGDGGTNDYKFKLPQGLAGFYTVTIDIEALTMTLDASGNTVLSAPLYLIGDATEGGWDLDKAKEMKATAENPRIVEWTGELTANTFKFVLAGNFNPALVASSDGEVIEMGKETKLTLNLNDGNDHKFKVTTAGIYTIRVDLDKLSMTVTAGHLDLYLIGGATAADWSTSAAIPFNYNGNNTYSLRTVLKVGSGDDPSQFKILGQKDWGPYSLHPETAGASIIGTNALVENGDDNKWKIAEDKQGLYEIAVDLAKKEITGTFIGAEKSIPESGYASFSARCAVEIPQGVKAYKAKIKGEKVVLTEIGGVIPANTGVILYSETIGVKTLNATDATATVTDNDLLATSVAGNETIPADGHYYALKADKAEFAIVDNETQLSGDKAYLKAPSSLAAKTLAIDFDATGIGSIVTENGNDGIYYTLQGVKTTHPGKGVYINKGRKVILK